MIILPVTFIWLTLKGAQCTESCWWTGCQKNDWKVTGCETYNRMQSDIRNCENGHQYFCCPKSGNNNLQITVPVESTETCWWTGCQKNDWKVRGCENYNRIQRAVRYCDNGEEYFCCPGLQTSQGQTTVTVTDDAESCWWTGCQKYDWAVRGCDNYNRVQSSVRQCVNGEEFYCCPKPGENIPLSNTPSSSEACWWTDCQRSDWQVQGCESFSRTQVDTRYCDNGQQYFCCPMSGETNIQTDIPDSQETCWWTGCQKDSWAVRGCENFNRIQKNVQACDHGQAYYCCPKSAETGQQQIVSNLDESCWWTGCQKNDWKVRGCENYNRIQVNFKYCENGEEYYCCPKTTDTNINTLIPNSPDDCWWTGCQKNDWKVQGCDNYNKVQRDVRYCEQGQEFFCCS